MFWIDISTHESFFLIAFHKIGKVYMHRLIGRNDSFMISQNVMNCRIYSSVNIFYISLFDIRNYDYWNIEIALEKLNALKATTFLDALELIGGQVSSLNPFASDQNILMQRVKPVKPVNS